MLTLPALPEGTGKSARGPVCCAAGARAVEALAAGVIGVLPDTTWARALVPEGYPFLWKDAAQAEAMLLRAVSDPDGCRAELDAIAGGDFAGRTANKHNDDDFEQAMLARLQEWF